MSQRQPMHLALVIGDAGFHQAGWRLPGSGVEQLSELRLFQGIAQRAEQACIDSLFVADVAGFDPASHSSWPTNQLEPLTLLSALAAVTSRIGLIGTVSTTFTPTYNLARQVLSLDHLSGGRAGVNIVTSRGGQALYGMPSLPSHASRYRQASESLSAARALWDSWSPEAVKADKALGRYGDPEEIYPADYQGESVKVRGALPTPRSPQGRPVVVQAGASEEGRDLAARYADVVFTMQPDAEQAASFYHDLKDRARRLGRDPASLRVLQGVTPISADTAELAQSHQLTLERMTDTQAALRRFAALLGGLDCQQLNLDEPVPALIREQSLQAPASTVVRALQSLMDQGRPLREVLQALVASRGHWTPVGSHDQVADALAQRFEDGHADGYVVLLADLAAGLDGLIEHLTPRLRTRGCLVSEYSGRTLREHLHLALPVWQRPLQGTDQ